MSSCVTPQGSTSDLILHGGRVWTGDASRPFAAAVAVRGGRIVAVGSDDEILRLRRADMRVVDLGGRLVVPGFIDSHVHIESGGEELLAPDLRSARSEEEFARRVGEFAATLPPGTWITSGAWDHENWPGGVEPTRAVLDRFTPRHPVLISRLDGHMAIANTLALDAAGITRTTPDPPGGTVVRDPATGEATGLLKDTAMQLVSRHVPPPSTAQRAELVRAALRHAASLGVTGLHDMGGRDDIYRELESRGELTARVTVYRPISRLSGPAAADGSAMVRTLGYKAFADGSLGSSTALFFEPYLGDPDNRGLALADLAPGGDLERQVHAADRRDEQLAIHAIGDRAIRELLDIYGRVGGDDTRSRRFRIEHAQHIHRDDIERFAELGVVASMQPYHAIDDGRWAEKRIDRERLETSYAFRDLIDAGAPLAFGSDWPVAPLSPIEGIAAAVTRATLDGKRPGGWFPRQKISVEEALRAYTAGSAYAGFADDDVGRIAPGMLADLVVLDRDVLSIDAGEIVEVGVVMTVVGGRLVYSADSAD